jgi:hypothetical protein
MLTFSPPKGMKGSWNQAHREALAMVEFLTDPATVASYMTEFPDAVMGIAEQPPAEEIRCDAYLNADGQLVIRIAEAGEQDG